MKGIAKDGIARWTQHLPLAWLLVLMLPGTSRAIDYPLPEGASYYVSCTSDENCEMGTKWIVHFEWDNAEVREVHVWFDFDCNGGGPPEPGEGWQCEPFPTGGGIDYTEYFCDGGEGWAASYAAHSTPKPTTVKFWLEWRGYSGEIPYTITWTELDCYDVENVTCFQ